MHKEGDEVHVDTTEASGGSKEGVVRWVLIVGTLLAIILLSAVWMTGAAFQGDREEEATMTGNIEAMEDDGDDTDGLVGDRLDEIDGAGTDATDSSLDTVANDTEE